MKGARYLLRLFKSKLFILLLTTITLFIVIGVTAKEDSKLHWVSNLLNSAVSPIQKVFSASAEKVDSSISFFKDSKAIKEENKKLREKIDLLEKENNELKGFKEKNIELRAALDLKNQLNEFDFAGANIIANDAGNWFNTFTIDRGTNDGIKRDNTVVSSRGLVGRITVSGPFTSKVTSIIDVDSTVTARVTKTADHVVVKGDINLKDKGLCKVEFMTAGADISVGDTIETSGMGGIFPKGIIVGKVKEVRQINSELNRFAIIEPAVDFNRIEEVYVLKNKSTVKDR